MTSFGAMAKNIAKLNFLGTFDFHNFKVEKGFGVQFEAVPMKGAVVEDNETNLNPDATWDQKEYGPLTDINPGEDKTSNLHFLLKVLNTGDMQEEWMSVDVIDEEGTQKSIKVHETHDESVKTGQFCVVHRAKMQDDVCVVDAWAMVAPAPASYSW